MRESKNDEEFHGGSGRGRESNHLWQLVSYIGNNMLSWKVAGVIIRVGVRRLEPAEGWSEGKPLKEIGQIFSSFSFF